MWSLLGLHFLKWLGAFTLVMVLLIVLFSLVGGISYDTSYRDTSWKWSINIHLGKGFENMQKSMENFRKNIQERFQGRRKEKEKDDDGKLFDLNIEGERRRELREFFKRKPRPVQPPQPANSA